MTTFPAISVNSLSKIYGRRTGVRALESLDLTVAPGEIFGLLGPNGAGKTTLIKILLGVVSPTSGSAAMFGLPAGVPEGRLRLGYLAENHRFPDFLTARQALDLYARMAGVFKPARVERIPGLLAQVKLSQWENTHIKKFSKGMMQRLGIAQALMNEPDLIFLDEPTDGVDPIGRLEIRDLLLSLADKGKTIFLNSHLLSEVEKVCTRVAILNRGRLVREGTVAELTGEKQRYTLTCTPLPDAFRARIGAMRIDRNGATSSTFVTYQLGVHDISECNKRIDEFRAAGILIESLQPARQSLEEYFVEVIKDA